MMATTESVHKKPLRIARGVRMDEDLWAFIDGLAEIMTGGNASALIEKWAREKRDAVRGAA